MFSVENGLIYKTYTVQTEKQIATVKEYVDVEYKIKLTVDKQQVQASATDFATVTASVLKANISNDAVQYLPSTSNSEISSIKFEVDGKIVETSGVLEFDPQVVGAFVIKTVNDNVVNDSVEVIAI